MKISAASVIKLTDIIRPSLLEVQKFCTSFSLPASPNNVTEAAHWLLLCQFKCHVGTFLPSRHLIKIDNNIVGALKCTSSGKFALFCINLHVEVMPSYAHPLMFHTFHFVCSLVLPLWPWLRGTHLLGLSPGNDAPAEQSCLRALRAINNWVRLEPSTGWGPACWIDLIHLLRGFISFFLFWLGGVLFVLAVT